MNCAIIHFEAIFSKWQQLFFNKKLIEKIKNEIEFEFFSVPVYLIPINREKPSKKAIYNFINYLKNENIDFVLLSDAAEVLPFASLIKNEFNLPKGNDVINFKLYDIIRKCAEKKRIALGDLSVRLITNKPEAAKNVILRIYKKVKEIKIQSENFPLFSDLSSYFLNEYGMFIETETKEINKNEIIIYLDGENKEADFSFNNSEIIFGGKKYFEKIKPYKPLNQKTLEFLLYARFGHLFHQNMKTFFDDYSLRVIKLIK